MSREVEQYYSVGSSCALPKIIVRQTMIGLYNSSMATDIILDCDPGHDDAIAALLALGAPELSVQAITTVAGNQTLGKTTRNAQQVLTLAERTEVPVASGMATPMVRDLTVAADVHGDSGLDGPELPDPDPAAEAVEEHAIEYIAQIARETDGLTLVPTGPLTNIGMLLRRYPDIVDQIDEIVLMGGAIGLGNYTPAAEFNILVDPEAADLVFRSAVPVTMIGLDVTRNALIRRAEFSRFRALDTTVGVTVAGWLEYFTQWYDQQFELDGVPIHDACAVAMLIDAGLIETEQMHVAVETAGDHTAGRTVCDRHGVRDAAQSETQAQPRNTRVGVDIDREPFLELLVDAVARY
ncbi:MAG: inosine-uridine nucleoside N-ribohydrolase [halophilic archaeon J07HX5]|nr:MAG: inosine-uridine nucleoside N-ribohydrolase [halophilic archaeon J07HX5]